MAAGNEGQPPDDKSKLPLAPANAKDTPPAAAQAPALPAAAAGTRLNVSPQLNSLVERAASGSLDDIKRLSKWAALVEQEAQMLRRRLRKQQHDFITLFEIVGQTSARSLDVHAMQTYLLRTVSGHFAAPKLLVMRRLQAEDVNLCCSAEQGMHAKTEIPIDSLLCQHALDRRFCFTLDEVPEAVRNASAVMALKALDLYLVVPLVQEVESSGAVLEGFLFLSKRLANLPYADEDLEFLQVLGKMFAICLRNESLYRRSIIDDLTGVASRGHFDAQLVQELNRIVTYGHRSMGLVMLDIDHFKEFNDKFGHQTGDRVLQELARVLVHGVRNVDLVARYGGEEFAIILLEIDRAKVLEVAERLRKSIEDMQVLSAQGQLLRITASFGLACFPDDAIDKSTLIQLSDEALYRSKDAGRNRVSMADPGSGLKRAVLGPRSATPVLTAPDARSVAGGASRSGMTLAVMGGLTKELREIQAQQRELALGDGEFPTPEPLRVATERRRGGLFREDRPQS